MPLYPLLFALHPALFLYLRNIREVSWPQALWASAASLGLVILLWPCTRWISADREKRGLSLLLFLLVFHAYGLYFKEIAGLLPQGWPPLAVHGAAVAPLAATWLVLIRLIRRSRASLPMWGRALNAAAMVLIAWTAAGIVLHFALANGRRPASTAPSQPAGGQSPPDIYCIVLDEFVAPEAALRLFAHDNRRFVADLRSLGFFVAEGSESRFARSEPALADLLNFGEYDANDDPYAQVRRNRVVSSLRGRGYRIIEFAGVNWLFLEAADQRFYYDLSHASLFFDDYYRTLAERTLLRFLVDSWRHRKTDLGRYYRQRILSVFADLPAAAAQAGPKFVYVHLLSPHEPFVFRADGGSVAPEHIWDHSVPRYYLEQYSYISDRIVKLVSSLLRESSRPPVILLLSDHGYRGSRRPDSIVPREEMRRVLNALYLPGGAGEPLPADLPPRNNFRLVFNLYFGGEFKLLPAAGNTERSGD